MSKQRLTVAITIGILAVAATALVVLRSTTPQTVVNPAVSTPTPSPSTPLSPSSTPTTSALSVITPLVDKGVTWLAKAETMPDQKLFSAQSADKIGAANFTYFRTARLDGGGELFQARCESQGPSITPCVFRFKRDAAGQVSYLANQNEQLTDTGDLITVLDKAVLFDTTTSYANLSAPDVIQTKTGSSLKRVIATARFLSEVTNTSSFDTSAYGELLKSADPVSEAPVQTRLIFLKHADGLVSQYVVSRSFVSDDRVPNVTYTGGQKNTNAFTTVVSGGCGGYGADATILTKSSDLQSRLKQIGKTSANDPIYGLINNDDPVMTWSYNNYKTGIKDAIPLTDFIAKQPVFVWKDLYGDYVLFTNEKYIIQAECGKPVIYLYPTKPTTVSVQVGADITKSEPTYGQGWMAIADPSGKLTVAGQTYPYLFWEGFGHGPYPIISQGEIIKSTETESALRRQMTALGLNQKEQTDFLEFWLPKMPKTPYIRLSWLGTTDMNRLAPLTVSPQPDTMLRVFLDFAGLEKPYPITPQKLTSTPRSGFTLVEWGGLLIGQ